jgi:hypothetical protein
MAWVVIVALILLALTALYSMEMAKLGRPFELFADYIGSVARPGLDTTDVALADFAAPPLLGDFLTEQPGLTEYTAACCAAVDRAREMELGGQYTQRTNNYKRDYPDNCSAPLTELVGSVYAPKDGVGLTVPCAGSC